jgi:hypothetical protein
LGDGGHTSLGLGRQLDEEQNDGFFLLDTVVEELIDAICDGLAFGGGPTRVPVGYLV